MLSGFENIGKIPELKRRVAWTLGLLAVYRIGVAVPTPGVDATALQDFFAQQAGNIFGLFNLFTGGALERFSIFALGIMPYISASIIVQLLTVVVPHLESLQKEGESGRRKISQYTRMGTVGLSIIQGFGMATWIQTLEASSGGGSIVLDPGMGFKIMTVITLTTGTVFLMWLGEQMTERGIGNGISVLIYAGIVAGLPAAIMRSIQLIDQRQLSVLAAVFLLALMAGVLWFIVFVERAQRRVQVQYAKRVVGRKVMGGQSTHLPLKLNVTGVIPPIFASSLLMFPLTVSNFVPEETRNAYPWVQSLIDSLNGQGFVYNFFLVILIIFFCYFYASIQFDPTKVADDMKKYGGYIPGIRPGKKTSEYLDRVLTRLTLVGSLYLSAVCVLPAILVGEFNVPFYFGGTGLLIVVGVAMDTMSQVETHLITRNYDGFLGGGSAGRRFRGRR